MTSPAEHAATVDSLRQRVVNGWRDPRPNMIEVVGALDEICALAARADELERERDEARVLLADAKDALALLTDCKGSFEGTVSERGGYPAVCPECDRTARALLARIEELEGRL